LDALRLLGARHYAVPFSRWVLILESKELGSRPRSEKRAVFQAVAHSAGEPSTSYFRELGTRSAWSQRKRKEELGTLAAEILGEVGTAPAVAALERGAKRMNRAIRQACRDALKAVEAKKVAAS